MGCHSGCTSCGDDAPAGLDFRRVILAANVTTSDVILSRGRYELRTTIGAAAGAVFVNDRQQEGASDGVPFCAEAPLTIDVAKSITITMRAAVVGAVAIMKRTP